MQVKLIRPYWFNLGLHDIGTVLDVTEEQAKRMMEGKYAVPVKPTPRNAMAKPAAETR